MNARLERKLRTLAIMLGRRHDRRPGVRDRARPHLAGRPAGRRHLRPDDLGLDRAVRVVRRRRPGARTGSGGLPFTLNVLVRSAIYAAIIIPIQYFEVGTMLSRNIGGTGPRLVLDRDDLLRGDLDRDQSAAGDRQSDRSARAVQLHHRPLPRPGRGKPLRAVRRHRRLHRARRAARRRRHPPAARPHLPAAHPRGGRLSRRGAELCRRRSDRHLA